MEAIKKASPKLSAIVAQAIKSELSKQKSLSAVASKLARVVNLNTQIALAGNDLNRLVSKAREIHKQILDPKSTAINFISGKVPPKVQAALRDVKSKFRF